MFLTYFDFFFFKQKTAYEMRISDWSSDVCSSDLILDTVARAGALFRSLGDPWADTTTPHGRLMLTVLGGLAEFERELIVTRTGEGRARAVARGQHMGRPPMLTAHQRTEALRALADGSATQADLARRFNVSQSTISPLWNKPTPQQTTRKSAV